MSPKRIIGQAGEVKLYPTKSVKVGDEVAYWIGAPGTGREIYVVTRVTRDGTPYGVRKENK